MKKILSIVMLLVMFMTYAIQAWATAPTMTNTNVFVASFDTGQATESANPGTYATVYTSETTGGQMSRVTSLLVYNSDTTTDHVCTCEYVNSGGTAYMFWQATVPHQTGVITPVDFLSSSVIPGLDVDTNGNHYLNLHNGDLLKCTYATALSNGAIFELAQVQNF